MAETTKLDSLKINLLTNAQYTTAKEAGEIDLNQLYMITDEVEEPVLWDSIEDRPFYDGEINQILEETTISTMITTGEFPFDVSLPVIVVFDGVQYECQIVTYEDESYTRQRVGNASLPDSNLTNTGEPFCLENSVGWGGNIYIQDEEEHVILAYQQISEMKQIDEKFIPDNIVRTEDVTTFIIKTWTFADTLPTMTVLNVGTYRFVDGMAWAEWVGSEYNTDDWMVSDSDSKVYKKDGSYTTYITITQGDTMAYVTADDVIISDRTYGTMVELPTITV